MGAISEYKKYYKKFNKEFFHGELPDVDIRIEKLKDKKAVGEFIYTAALKHQDGKKEKFFDIKKAVFNKSATLSRTSTKGSARPPTRRPRETVGLH